MGKRQESESLDSAFAELKEANRSLEDASTRTIETERKADDAHDRIRSHRDRCRRATKELKTAEEDLNDSLGRMGQLIKDTSWATDALSCGVPDRESKKKSATSKKRST